MDTFLLVHVGAGVGGYAVPIPTAPTVVPNPVVPPRTWRRCGSRALLVLLLRWPAKRWNRRYYCRLLA